ncbi:PREDICTED: uncharacterized protein LOC103079505 [Lipotes vexillifer]|uniref:Uncharacterized protein LOC103079505 n=1 Tax=Lipotes vexillifer TaxID=118797 RepID=A0A340XC35_LIPVE|nr:PREDICTED: uncharacterized protein LOC103079505 [Lipotes vexillifer]
MEALAAAPLHCGETRSGGLANGGSTPVRGVGTLGARSGARWSGQPDRLSRGHGGGWDTSQLLIGRAPLPGRAAKLGRRGTVSSAQAEVLGQPDFDAKKFSGLWYMVPMVSDCKVFRDKKDNLLTSTSNVKATAEGSLCVHMQLPGDPCSAPGRTQEASPQALKAFQDFYRTVGLPEDMVVTLPKSGPVRVGYPFSPCLLPAPLLRAVGVTGPRCTPPEHLEAKFAEETLG